MTLRKKFFENIVGKGEMLLTMFSSFPETNFNFLVTFILSSANALDLNWLKILPIGKALTRPLQGRTLLIENSYFHYDIIIQT